MVIPAAEEFDHRANLGQMLDPNIKIKAGSILSDFLEENPELSINPTSNSSDYNEQVLSIVQIKELWKKIHGDNPQEGKRKIYLHELLNGSDIQIPELEIPPRDPELEKRINMLRMQQEEREYQRMTKNVDLSRSYRKEDSLSYQMKQMNSGLIGVFQLIISVLAAFGFGFMGPEVLLGYKLDLAVSLLLGIICALVVGIADLYFFVISMSFTEEQDAKNLKKWNQAQAQQSQITSARASSTSESMLKKVN